MSMNGDSSTASNPTTGVIGHAKERAAQTLAGLGVPGSDIARVNGQTNGQQASPVIDQADIDHWHRHGFVIVKNFISPEELKAVHDDFHQYMPTWEEFIARKPMFRDLNGNSTRSLPGWIRHEFPYEADVINKMAVHPFLVAFAERLVGHSNIALSHGAIVGKYAGLADYDQELHPDYTNNTLVAPGPGTESIDIPMIIYYTDVTVDLGPTYVVSKEKTEHLIRDGRRFHPRAEFPELYKAEQPAVCPAGSVLIYNMRTFHRGSIMFAKEGMRYSQFTAFHTTDKPWLGSNSFQMYGGSPGMNRFITNATPRERELVGFPAPSDPYWQNEEARAAVANRYPEIDMTVYGGRP